MDDPVGVAGLGGVGWVAVGVRAGDEGGDVVDVEGVVECWIDLRGTVKVTFPAGATVTCAPVMAPVPEVGVTVDPGVAVAVQEPGISPAGVASVTVP